MKQNFTLRIEKPCSEDFNKFRPTEAGGFCDSCSTDVRDFSRMSEEEIIHYFQQNGGKMCGRFRKDQLKTYALPTSAPQQNRLSRWLSPGIVGLSLLSFLSAEAASSPVPKPSVIFQFPEKKEPKSVAPADTIKKELTVKGVVREEENIPLPGVNIHIQGTDRGTVADMDGKFSLKGVKEGDVLLFSFITYETKQYTVKKNQPELITIEIKLKECDFELTGAVSVDRVYSSKQSFWQKVKNMFR